jgi:hypothetical protein
MKRDGFLAMAADTFVTSLAAAAAIWMTEPTWKGVLLAMAFLLASRVAYAHGWESSSNSR